MARTNGAAPVTAGAADEGRKVATSQERATFKPKHKSDRAPSSPQVTHEEWTKRIAAAWQKGVEAILETGRLLIEAKAKLKHGEFEAMIQLKLPFTERTAQRLMVIARHPVISNATHVSLLPPSWSTLYELAQLPYETLVPRIKDGSITPKLERKDVALLREPKPLKPQPDKVWAELEEIGDVETVTTSIDTKGSKQPAKRRRTPDEIATDNADHMVDEFNRSIDCRLDCFDTSLAIDKLSDRNKAIKELCERATRILALAERIGGAS